MKWFTEPGARRRARIIPLVIAAAFLYGAYYYAHNQNVVFLTILAAVTVSVIITCRSAKTASAAAVLAGAWALSPVAVAPPPLVDPAPVDDVSHLTKRIGEDEWHYRFTPRGLRRHVHDCGPLGATIYVYGNNITENTISVRVDGVRSTTPQFLRSNGLDLVQITAELEDERTVSVTLRGRPHQKPAVRLGPEAVGRTIYSDAVFLELRNRQCAVTYHAVREVRPVTGG